VGAAGLHRRCQSGGERGAGLHDDRDRGHDGPVGGAYGRGHRQTVHRDLPVIDREPVRSHVRQDTTQHVRAGHGQGGVPGEWTGKHGLLHLGRSEGQQHAPDTGGMQRKATTDTREHWDGAPSGDALDVDRLLPFPDRQLHVSLGDREEVPHEGQGELAQAQTPGGKRGNLPQPEPDVQRARGVPFEQPALDQLTDEAVGRR